MSAGNLLIGAVIGGAALIVAAGFAEIVGGGWQNAYVRSAIGAVSVALVVLLMRLVYRPSEHR